MGNKEGIKEGNMFAIFESNGGVEIGLTCKADGSGEAEKFNTKEEAEKFAQENCAFDYSIVKL
jgi:hypothetical protein